MSTCRPLVWLSICNRLVLMHASGLVVDAATLLQSILLSQVVDDGTLVVSIWI